MIANYRDDELFIQNQPTRKIYRHLEIYPAIDNLGFTIRGTAWYDGRRTTRLSRSEVVYEGRLPLDASERAEALAAMLYAAYKAAFSWKLGDLKRESPLMPPPAWAAHLMREPEKALTGAQRKQLPPQGS